jgi:phosphonate transport system substrate-binding protein
VVVTRNYQEMEQRLQDGSVDFAMVSPAAYVRFVSRVCYVATYAEWSEITQALSPYYHSVMISLKESPIEALQDLEGKNFGFTDRESTSGHRVPRRMLLQEGIEPEKFFKKVFYLGRHDAVIESLLAGSIQGGAVSDGTLYAAISQYGDLFRVLALSDPIPLDPVVASPSVPEEDVALLREVLLSLPLESSAMEGIREILGWPGAGFVLLDTHFYDSLREALEIEIPKEDHDI